MMVTSKSDLSFAEMALLVRAKERGGSGPNRLHDIHDFMSAIHPFTIGHPKWDNAQYCVAFIALNSLRRKGYLTWEGKSKALGRDGWHGGHWRLTEKGAAWAEAYIKATTPPAEELQVVLVTTPPPDAP